MSKPSIARRGSRPGLRRTGRPCCSARSMMAAAQPASQATPISTSAIANQPAAATPQPTTAATPAADHTAAAERSASNSARPKRRTASPASHGPGVRRLASSRLRSIRPASTACAPASSAITVHCRPASAAGSIARRGMPAISPIRSSEDTMSQSRGNCRSRSTSAPGIIIRPASDSPASIRSKPPGMPSAAGNTVMTCERSITGSASAGSHSSPSFITSSSSPAVTARHKSGASAMTLAVSPSLRASSITRSSPAVPGRARTISRSIPAATARSSWASASERWPTRRAARGIISSPASGSCIDSTAMRNRVPFRGIRWCGRAAVMAAPGGAAQQARSRAPGRAPGPDALCRG